MKNIYELLNDINIDESEFEEMEVSEIEKVRVKSNLKKSIYKKGKWEKATIAASCGLISLGIFGTIFPSYARDIPVVSNVIQTVDTIRGYFLTNENGETYGTFIEKEDGEYEEPDLMAVVGLGGVEGYVRKSDLYNEANQPNTPEEAIEYQRKRDAEGPRIIPVYKEDGVTVIGKYRID